MHNINIEDIFGSFGDIFEGMFGGSGRRQQGPRRGADLRIRVPVTWQQTIDGASRSLNIPRHDACGSCEGTGSASKAPPTLCGHCGGSGQVAARQGFFVMSTPCPTAQDRATPTCSACAGTGKERTRRRSRSTSQRASTMDADALARRRRARRSGPALLRPLVVFQTQPPPDGWERDRRPTLHPRASGCGARRPTHHRGPRELKVAVPAGASEGRRSPRGEGLDDVGRPARSRRPACRLIGPSKLSRQQRKAWEKLREQSRRHAIGGRSADPPRPPTNPRRR